MGKKIMVRLRGSKPSYRVLFEGETLPDIGLQKPTGLETAIRYSPTQTSNDKSQVYFVELDQEQKNKMVDPYIEAVNYGAESAVQADYSLVNAVYKISGRRLVLSRINPSSRIGENGKTMIAFKEGGVAVSRLSFSVDVSGDVDAYYDGMSKIYFTKFSKAKGLFRDFDEFYQEAHYDNNEAFLESDLFAVGEIEPEDIGTTDTNKIIAIQNNNSLDLQSPKTIKKIQDYARKYPLSGVILNADGRIKITTKDDLTCTINLLTQRYYTSEITGEVLQARGSEKMKDQKAKKVFNGVEVNNRADK